MLIAPADDPRYRMVTFRWSPPSGALEPRDVLLCLETITDKAYADGDLSPFLLNRGGSNEWGLTLRLRADLRCSYRFYADYKGMLRGELPGEDVWYGAMRKEGAAADPLNPHRVPAIDDRPPWSLLALPDAPAQPWLGPNPDNPAGTMQRHELTSELLGNTRRIWLYHPPGHAEHDAPLPVLVLLDGDCWIDLGIEVTLDNLIAAGAIEPVAVLLVDSMDSATRTRELAGDGRDSFLRFLLDELFPWAHAKSNITTNPRRTAIGGQSFGGLSAAYAGLHAPQRFGLVLSQSGSFWWPRDEEFQTAGTELISQYVAAERVPVRFYLEAGLAEWLLLDANRHMRDVLLAKGYVVTYREYHGGHDYACWRGGIADGLVALLGARDQAELA